MSHEKSWVLTGSDLEGLELITSGLLGSVDSYSLPDQTGPAPRAALNVPAHLADRGDVVLLCDPDNTALARLVVAETADAGDGERWLAGAVDGIRDPEHGLGRERRLTTASDLAGHVVAVFGGQLHAADVLAAFDAAGRGRLALVATGSADMNASARLLRDLEACAARRPDTTVWFIPFASIGPEGGDIPLLVLGLRGADAIHDFRRPGRARAGAVVLLTGLSGAGKSTIARALTESIAGDASHRPVLLDGDDMRRELAGELGFGPADRDRNLRRIAWVAARVADVGGLAVCAPIAPFAASRAAMRALVEPAAPFLIVHVSTPLEVAEGRDRKGLYARARAGQIPDFTGIDSPYEPPDDAALVVDASRLTVSQAVEEIRAMLSYHGVIGGTEGE